MSDKTTINLNYMPEMLNETVYSQFAGQVQALMWQLYDAGMDIPMSLIGRPTQVNSFMRALEKEKRYLDSYIDNGLTDDRTLMNKHNLMDAVKKFEQETGLRWPFKN